MLLKLIKLRNGSSFYSKPTPGIDGDENTEYSGQVEKSDEFSFPFGAQDFNYLLDGLLHGKSRIVSKDVGIIEEYYYFRGMEQGAPMFHNSYQLNGKQRIQLDDIWQHYQDVLDTYFSGDKMKFSRDVPQSLNRDIIRTERILKGIELEWLINDYDEEDLEKPVVLHVLENLAKNPGDYDRITYEQLIPDYYHLLEQNIIVWGNKPIPSIYL